MFGHQLFLHGKSVQLTVGNDGKQGQSLLVVFPLIIIEIDR